MVDAQLDLMPPPSRGRVEDRHVADNSTRGLRKR